jgi:hypothetical protein
MSLHSRDACLNPELCDNWDIHKLVLPWWEGLRHFALKHPGEVQAVLVIDTDSPDKTGQYAEVGQFELVWRPKA